LTDNYIKAELQRIFKQIAKWKSFKIHAWHIGDDHIHLYFSIPPKYSVSYIVGILKGKSSAWIKKKTKKIPQGSLWCTGYYITTTGLNEIAVKRYIENQQHHKVAMAKLF
jgi:putative transposase